MSQSDQRWSLKKGEETGERNHKLISVLLIAGTNKQGVNERKTGMRVFCDTNVIKHNNILIQNLELFQTLEV